MFDINIMNILLIFLLTIIIAYLFGLTLINLVDNRLSKIKLNIPQQEIVISYPESFKNMNDSNNDVINNNNGINNNNNGINNNYGKIKNNNGNSANSNGKNEIIGVFDKEYYNNMSKDKKINGFSNNPDDSYKNWDFEKKKTQACHKYHNHSKERKDTQCNYGTTNYADPNDMSDIDYKIFILNYPNNMTLQDYINWLYCFKDKKDQLPYNHLKNLEKMEMGKELIVEEGILPPPGYYFPKMNAEDYFDKMYNNETNEFNTAPPLNSNTASMLGYNCDDYSEFSQNLDLYGSTGKLRNPDIGKKKNAKKLYNYIAPKDSNSININNENEIYHIKNIEV